jgi:hypothetical protein
MDGICRPSNDRAGPFVDPDVHEPILRFIIAEG